MIHLNGGDTNLACGTTRNEIFDDKFRCHRLCADGNVVELSLLLKQRKNEIFDIEDEYFGWNPLHWAAYFGKLDCLQLLLTQTSILNEPSRRFRQTPLHLAAFAGRSDCVEFLLRSGADINKQDYLEESALHKAARTGNLECLSILIKHGANFELTNKDGLSAERICFLCGHLQAFDFFLQIRPRRSAENGYSQLKPGTCDSQWILSGLNGGHLPQQQQQQQQESPHNVSHFNFNGMSDKMSNGHSNCEMDVEMNNCISVNGRNGFNGRKRSNDEMNNEFIKRMKHSEDSLTDPNNVDSMTSVGGGGGGNILPCVPRHQNVENGYFMMDSAQSFHYETQVDMTSYVNEFSSYTMLTEMHGS